MEILAHRGCWQDAEDRNSMPALTSALDRGFGLETDIRDRAGELVIAHDVPDATSPLLSDLLDYYCANHCRGTLALNIKADGLQVLVAGAIRQHGIESYFLFDMSVPDSLAYLASPLLTYIRVSEVETENELLSLADGLWVDELTRPWLNKDALRALVATGRPLSVVSPELHGRNEQAQWRILKEIMPTNTRIMLCTDYPERAQEYFR